MHKKFQTSSLKDNRSLEQLFLTIGQNIFWNKIHTVILPDWSLKSGASLILPSSIARNSLAPNAKIFLNSCEGFLRAALSGRSHPGPFWKIAKVALFYPCIEFENFLGQMTSFEVLCKCHCLTLSKKCLRLRSALSKCLSTVGYTVIKMKFQFHKILPFS